MLIEFYTEDEAQCLINSIPIKEIIGAINVPVSYRKVEVIDPKTIVKYEINVLPALLIIKEGKTIFKYEGFVKEKEKTSLLDKMAF